jgi:hypothetical protein
MYERFTDRARKVMQLANEEARRFNHEYIGTEHILLGLVKEGSGVAANVLKNLDIDLRKIRLEVEKIVQSGPDMVTMGKLPQTPRAKKVIEFSIEEARNCNHNYVGSEHLLLGLLRDEAGVGGQVLRDLGLSLEGVREEVMAFVGHDITTRPVVPISKVERRTAHEFDLYLPLRRSDGSLVDSEKIDGLKRKLYVQFRGYLSFSQRCEGCVLIGSITFRDEFVILRVLSEESGEARKFFLQLKEEMKAALQLEDVLILIRKVEIL